MVGAMRSSRVASVTRPFSIGTLRSTRSSTRLPFTSTSSRVRKVLVIDGLVRPILRDASLRSAPQDEVSLVVRSAHFAHVSNHEAKNQSSFPIATAVSAIRLEKPHSLSYHAITRTSVAFCTLVWPMWKVAECGSWLKSIETLGKLV